MVRGGGFWSVAPTIQTASEIAVMGPDPVAPEELRVRIPGRGWPSQGRAGAAKRGYNCRVL